MGRRAGAAIAFAVVAAGAGIGGGHQHEGRGEFDLCLEAGDAYAPVLDRPPEGLDDRFWHLPDLIEKKHARMGEGDLPGEDAFAPAPADDCRQRSGVVRGAEGPPADQPVLRAGLAGDRVDLARDERFLLGHRCTKTGNKPGVTIGKQWIRINKNVELLDTPGILWPKFEDQKIGLHIAFIGSINDDILYPEDMALELIKILMKDYPLVLKERYDIDVSEENGKALEILEMIGQKRGCLKKGAEIDLLKASKILIDDFRTQKLGRITLEMPE